MILARVVVMRLAAVVLRKKIKNAQFGAMLVMGMPVVRVKMSHQRRYLSHLLRKRRQSLREQDKGEKCGNAMFHRGAKVENNGVNSIFLVSERLVNGWARSTAIFVAALHRRASNCAVTAKHTAIA